MKNKSWIIILIMGIALAISLAYSIWVSQRTYNSGESTVTTTSIIEMTATTVTIKNTLTGTGTIEFKEKTDTEDMSTQNTQDAENEQNQSEEEKKSYQITLSIEEKDLEKAQIGQEVEISIKQEETLNYMGKVTNITQNPSNKSTINIEVINEDEKIEENMIATCKVIVEKAENVVALPIEAIQKNSENQEFVDVVQADGSTKPIIIETGISDDYYVEISSGLSVGDRVQIIKSSTTVVKEKLKNENFTSDN